MLFFFIYVNDKKYTTRNGKRENVTHRLLV